MSQSSSKKQKVVFSIFLIFCSLVAGIFLSEFILRFTILGEKEYENEAIRFAMENLRADDDVGFLWKRNLHLDNSPGWYDQEKFPLITDENGFFNPQQAIEKKRLEIPVNIVGIGDSFMHGATYDFYDFFNKYDLFFYNMSMSRHCPPQYNIILKKYALPLKPEWVIYSIYENDFDETPDFENWQKTHSDWFTYHSGTWFGPAVHLPIWRSYLEKYAPGISMLEKRIRRQFDLGVPSYLHSQILPLTEEEKSEKVYAYIQEAYEMTNQAGSSFLCLIIPARDVNADGRTGRDGNYDTVYARLMEYGIPTLDLRPIFNAYPERRKLYYTIDAHWNGTGIEVAAKHLLHEIAPESRSLSFP
jgi:hypothetical protein